MRLVESMKTSENEVVTSRFTDFLPQKIELCKASSSEEKCMIYKVLIRIVGIAYISVTVRRFIRRR